MIVSKRLSSLASSVGATQYSLAKSTGLSQSYIARLMKGEKNPTIETLEKLCAALGVTLAVFFSDDSPTDPAEARLLAAFRRLPDDKRDTVVTMIEAL